MKKLVKKIVKVIAEAFDATDVRCNEVAKYQSINPYFNYYAYCW